MTLADSLREYIKACFTGLWIESHEHDDALAEIAQLASAEKWRLAVWDLEQGLRVAGAIAEDNSSSDPLAAIRAINALAQPDSSALLVLVNFRRDRGAEGARAQADAGVPATAEPLPVPGALLPGVAG